MELTYRCGVFTAFVANLMADRKGFLDFGSVPFSMVKPRGKRNVFDMTLVFGNFCMIGRLFQRCLGPKAFSYFRATKAPKTPCR